MVMSLPVSGKLGKKAGLGCFLPLLSATVASDCCTILHNQIDNTVCVHDFYILAVKLTFLYKQRVY